MLEFMQAPPAAITGSASAEPSALSVANVQTHYPSPALAFMWERLSNSADVAEAQFLCASAHSDDEMRRVVAPPLLTRLCRQLVECAMRYVFTPTCGIDDSHRT